MNDGGQRTMEKIWKQMAKGNPCPRAYCSVRKHVRAILFWLKINDIYSLKLIKYIVII